MDECTSILLLAVVLVIGAVIFYIVARIMNWFEDRYK